MHANQPADVMPPANSEFERLLLGCVLLKPQLLTEIRDVVAAADFYEPQHQTIFRAMVAMQGDGIPIDLATVPSRLAEQRELAAAGGTGYIVDCCRDCPTTLHYKFWANEILEKSQLRMLKYHATELLDDLAHGVPTKSLIASAQNRLADLQKELGLSKPPQTTTLASAAKKRAAAIGTKAGMLRKLGFPELDYAIGGGVRDGEMIIFGARPNHCKSLVALQSIHEQTLLGDACVIISEEMTAETLGERTLLFSSDIPREDWDENKIVLATDAELYEQTHAACYVVTGSVHCARAIEQITKAVQEYGAKYAVVDYAQLLESPGRTEYEQVKATSAAMKRCAIALNIPLLLLCQLNREIEKSKTFIPTNKDLRGAGQLEQDADVVIFGVWPHRLNPENNATDYQFFVTKNRNRPIRKAAVPCKINPSRQYIDATKPSNYTDSFDRV